MTAEETIAARPSALVQRRLRVTVVTPFGVLGGAERWLLAVLGATDRLDAEVVLLADGPLRTRLAAMGVPTQVVPTGRRPLDVAGAALRVAGLLRSRRPEVVLANGVKGAAVALPAGWLAGVGTVWVKHDMALDRQLARPLGRMADHVIAVSDAAAHAVRRADVTVMPPPRPDRAPAPRAVARQFWSDRGLDLRGPTVAMATRLLPSKGVDDMIRALAHVDARSWTLVVIGGDDYSAPGETRRLTALATAQGVADRVRFVGPVEDAGHWLSAFDAVAVLTRSDGADVGGEGYSLTALEAVLADTSLIATSRVPAARGHAVVVPPADPGAVARALLTLATGAGPSAVTSRLLLANHPDAARVADVVAARLAAVAARPGAGCTTSPPVSIVTTVLNEHADVARLCDAVVPQLRHDDEFIVVDGGSTDGTVARCRSLARGEPRIRVIEAPGTGIAAGRNVGVAAARHAIVAFTDAGCVPVAGWLDALRAAFAESDPVAVVSGPYRVVANSPIEHATAAACYPQPREIRRRTLLVRCYGVFGSTFNPTTPTGRSSACDRDRLREIGGFDDALATAEDVTIGRRMAQVGWRCVLAGDAEVAWTQRPTIRSQMRMWYEYGRGDGHSGDRLLMARNVARAAAYVGVGALAWSKRARPMAAIAAAAYLSLPAVRVLTQGRPLPALALLPIALATKDLSKVCGCARGVLQMSRRRRSATRPSLVDVD